MASTPPRWTQELAIQYLRNEPLHFGDEARVRVVKVLSKAARIPAHKMGMLQAAREIVSTYGISELKKVSDKILLNALLIWAVPDIKPVKTRRKRKDKGPRHGTVAHGWPTQNEINAFYASWEWKRLRYDFLLGKDRICQCCGAKASDTTKIVVDHIRPIRRYWLLRLDQYNLQILCEDCNMGKGSRDTTHFKN